MRQLCRYRFPLVDNSSDLKRQVITVVDQVFPEYETLFFNMFGSSSQEMLAAFSTSEEFLAVDTECLAGLLKQVSCGRFGISKAQEIQDAARHFLAVTGIGKLIYTILHSCVPAKFMFHQFPYELSFIHLTFYSWLLDPSYPQESVRTRGNNAV